MYRSTEYKLKATDLFSWLYEDRTLLPRQLHTTIQKFVISCHKSWIQYSEKSTLYFSMVFHPFRFERGENIAPKCSKKQMKQHFEKAEKKTNINLSSFRVKEIPSQW